MLRPVAKARQSAGIDYSALAFPKGGKRRESVDKSKLALGIPERVEDDAYLASARDRACECCGRLDGQSVVACHVNTEQAGGTALKAGDDLTLFLCSDCHRDMDTDPRGIPVWITENVVKPWLRRRYRAWVAGGDRAWRTLNAVAAIAVSTAVNLLRGRAAR